MDDASVHRVRLLDGFSIILAGTGSSTGTADLPRRLQRIVAHVCLSGRPVRTAIAGRLWPDVPEGHACGSLRSALWQLRKTAPGLVEVYPDSLALASGVRVDVRDLHDWAQRAMDPAAPLAELATPDTSLCGDLLPGWYDDWVLLERERLAQLRVHALEVVAARLAAAGRHGQAIQAAYAAVQTEPLRESAYRTVIRVHLAEGNVADALRVFERFRILLRDEIGVAPTDRMAQLVRDLGRTPLRRR